MSKRKFEPKCNHKKHSFEVTIKDLTFEVLLRVFQGWKGPQACSHDSGYGDRLHLASLLGPDFDTAYSKGYHRGRQDVSAEWRADTAEREQAAKDQAAAQPSVPTRDSALDLIQQVISDGLLKEIERGERAA